MLDLYLKYALIFGGGIGFFAILFLPFWALYLIEQKNEEFSAWINSPKGMLLILGFTFVVWFPGVLAGFEVIRS